MGKLKRKRGCDPAMADALNPPRVNEVDLSDYTGKMGDIIRAEVVDDFEARRVCLAITKLDGTLLEDGAAVLLGGPEQSRQRHPGA